MPMTVDAHILSALRESPDGSVSGADLSHELGISRAAIWARIEELRALGYDIEASPHLGYRLLSAPDLLHADDLHSRLGKTRVIGRDIRVFERTTSTNDIIARLARDGPKKGQWYLPNRKAADGAGWAGCGFLRRAKGFGFPYCCGRICLRSRPRR